MNYTSKPTFLPVCVVLSEKYPSRSTNWAALRPYAGNWGHSFHSKSNSASWSAAGEFLEHKKSTNAHTIILHLTDSCFYYHSKHNSFNTRRQMSAWCSKCYVHSNNINSYQLTDARRWKPKYDYSVTLLSSKIRGRRYTNERVFKVLCSL